MHANQPSVPSLRVVNFSSNASICDANAPLTSRSCLRFSSSSLFDAIRAARGDDCCEERGCIEDCRREEEVPVEENTAVGLDIAYQRAI